MDSSSNRSERGDHLDESLGSLHECLNFFNFRAALEQAPLDPTQNAKAEEAERLIISSTEKQPFPLSLSELMGDVLRPIENISAQNAPSVKSQHDGQDELSLASVEQFVAEKKAVTVTSTPKLQFENAGNTGSFSDTNMSHEKELCDCL